jgi:hypothetical protein
MNRRVSFCTITQACLRPSIVVALSMASCGRIAIVAPDGGQRDSSADVDSPLTENDARVRDADVDAPPETGGCGKCSGCCRDNTCVDLASENVGVCGFNGSSCESCLSNGTCVRGACVYPRLNCGPLTCSGCCVDANHCADGVASDTCGFNGHSCQDCGGGMCEPQLGGGGDCQLPCDLATCSGCCEGSACLLGNTDLFCGTSGQSCVTCPSGESCTSQSGGGSCM